MKPREPRRPVMINARFRGNLGWSDARILNVSSRGLLLNAERAPDRGAYIEVSRGPHRIIGRVVWVRKDRFGVSTQGKIAVDDFASGGETGPAAAELLNLDRGGSRGSSSGAARQQRSGARGRSMQFACLAAFGAAAATLAFDAVGKALSRPLAAVSAELSRGK